MTTKDDLERAKQVLRDIGMFDNSKECIKDTEIIAQAIADERERCVSIVANEPELPDDPPEEMMKAMKDHPVECMRFVVIATKKNIIQAILSQGKDG